MQSLPEKLRLTLEKSRSSRQNEYCGRYSSNGYFLEVYAKLIKYGNGRDYEKFEKEISEVIYAKVDEWVEEFLRRSEG